MSENNTRNEIYSTEKYCYINICFLHNEITGANAKCIGFTLFWFLFSFIFLFFLPFVESARMSFTLVRTLSDIADVVQAGDFIRYVSRFFPSGPHKNSYSKKKISRKTGELVGRRQPFWIRFRKTDNKLRRDPYMTSF